MVKVVRMKTVGRNFSFRKAKKNSAASSSRLTNLRKYK